ncbi:MAG: hypothetical protein HKO92_03635 [Flavobacteriaceae bacterium]|nr:hypothetical protein [Bacteroidia bacterium]NNK82196.1 hypothetical protein [Flavobacteriaceae bacterium]
MGQLSFRLILFLCFIQFVFSQDTLCVYKSKGTSLLNINNLQTSLKKGTLLNKGIVKVLSNAEFTAVDNNGNTYLINKEGDYSLKHLLNFKVKQNASNFTSSYFKHIWDELRNNSSDKARIAGVFRGDYLMRHPVDSSKIASSKIKLTWLTENDTTLYYVFIKNIMTDEIMKLETNGSQLALYDDNPIFYDSDTFKWTVTTEAFPNLDNIPFFSFELIDRTIYENLKKDYKAFINDLAILGHSETEIETILCERYALCK